MRGRSGGAFVGAFVGGAGRRRGAAPTLVGDCGGGCNGRSVRRHEGISTPSTTIVFDFVGLGARGGRLGAVQDEVERGAGCLLAFEAKNQRVASFALQGDRSESQCQWNHLIGAVL
jgi:hypothetical protein